MPNVSFRLHQISPGFLCISLHSLFTFYPHKPAAERHHHASGDVYDDVQCNMVFSLMARELNIGLSNLRFSFQLTTKSPTCLLENYSRDIKSLLLSSAFSSSLCTFPRMTCSRPIYSCVTLLHQCADFVSLMQNKNYFLQARNIIFIYSLKQLLLLLWLQTQRFTVELSSHGCSVGSICMHTGPHTGQALKPHVV